MPTASAMAEDTEITLGVGKLLGLFFLLAAICGVFFSIGYSLGRGAGREQAANDQAPTTVAVSEPAPANHNLDASKPSAAVEGKQEAQAAPENKQTQLTFYKAVQQNSTGHEPEAAAAHADEPRASETPRAATVTNTAAKTTEASLDHGASTPVTGPGTIVVQIAALSREDDAVSLAGALRKKGYNVFVVNNPINNDKLYHVQVGPFATVAEAQAMKGKLVAEGYNPILKR